MDPLVTHPTPSYPANYARRPSSRHNTLSSSQHEPPAVVSPSTSRKDSTGLGVPSLSSKRNQSFLSLASLSLAHSSSSLLGIFAAASDSVPPTPLATPPIEGRRVPALVEEVDRWGFVRDMVRSMSLLFAMGYGFAMSSTHDTRLSELVLTVG